MPDTPLNPDACKSADEAMDLRMKEFFAGLMTDGEMVDVIVSAYLAVAHPVVNSVEELDALPDGSIVKDSEGEVYIMTPYDEFWRVWGNDKRFSSSAIALPARVLHRPEVSNA